MEHMVRGLPEQHDRLELALRLNAPMLTSQAGKRALEQLASLCRCDNLTHPRIVPHTESSW